MDLLFALIIIIPFLTMILTAIRKGEKDYNNPDRFMYLAEKRVAELLGEDEKEIVEPKLLYY